MNIVKHSYNGSLISQESDGYVSLTDMAKASGKLVADYLKIKATKEYLETLSTDMNINLSALVRVSKGGSGKQGTWAHPEVAIDFAQWCSVPFRIWANRTLRGAIQSQNKQGAYVRRVMLMHSATHNIPDGYWCVLHESAELLIWIESVMGYPVDKDDIVDISIGQAWAKERTGKPWAKQRTKCQYNYPDGREVSPWIYSFDELPHFKMFLNKLYKPKILPRYLQDKYGKLAKTK